MQPMILFACLASTYLMVAAKRLPALIRAFRYQSFCLFLATAGMAYAGRHFELYMIAALVLALKVCLIPHLLYRITARIRASEDLGLFMNAQLSMAWALAFTWLAWAFTARFMAPAPVGLMGTLTLAFFMAMAGIFLMIFRMTALAQMVGLLTMENGIFLLASAVSGGMPFFVEIAIFLDVFVSVLIMGFFVYRINRLFTHIDVNKLSSLRG